MSFSATERIAKNCQKFSGNITIQALVGRQHPYVLTPITEQARVSRSDWLSFLEEHHTEVNFFCSGVITRGTPWKPWGAWRQLDLRAAILILTEHLVHQSNKIHAIYPPAERQNMVDATARLGAVIGQDGCPRESGRRRSEIGQQLRRPPSAGQGLSRAEMTSWSFSQALPFNTSQASRVSRSRYSSLNC